VSFTEWKWQRNQCNSRCRLLNGDLSANETGLKQVMACSEFCLVNMGLAHVQKVRDPFSIYSPSDFSLHHMAIGTDSIIIRSSRIDLQWVSSKKRGRVKRNK